LCVFAPIQIFISLIVIVAAGIDGKYMGAFWKTLASFLFGLLIYLSYLYPNLEWYHLNNKEATVEEQESAMIVVEQPTDEMEMNEMQAEL